MYSLVGAGGDGKSVLLGLFDAVMNNTINGNLCGHTPIDELGDKFALQSLVAQVCNISDDTNDKIITNTGIIKTLIGAGGTGTGITVCRKNMTDFFWNDPQILLIIAGNQLPKFKDTSEGMSRRIVYLPFKNSLKNRQGEMDLRLGQKLRLNPMNLAVLFNVGRYAITDAKTKGELTEMNESKLIKERAIDTNKDELDKFVDWINEKYQTPIIEKWLLGDAYEASKCAGGTGIDPNNIGQNNERTTQDVYQEYLDWRGSDFAMSTKAFSKNFLNKLDYNIEIVRKKQRVQNKIVTLSYFTA